ncbi:hypothetical protein E0F88_28570 [Dyadobacter psychrotolerans]|uniref:Transposase (putative) YhgA-like domain-containing protein n=1 Tax=Dyadobacter psychrotolerans TaxID=2541721 RepID=A0A4R5DE63_9BACT|nr:hypothetical protein E0F88_28570 [Dyadobacter psychrotolerans]
MIPILLYHGRGKWKYQPLSGLFKNLDPEWKQFIPDFDYVYNNLGEISDQQVEALQNKFLAASLLSLKHSFEKKWLEGNALKILILSNDASENLQRNLAVYIFANSSLTEQKIIELMKSLPSNIKNTLMSTLDLLEKRAVERGLQKGIEQGIAQGLEQGIERGIEKGMERGLQKGIEQGIELGKSDIVKNLLTSTDFTTEKIAILTGVNEKIIEKIRNELNSGKQG